eukprot:Skav234759  [mRNA]  locus=scaffold2327:79052:85672:+ [translate_table: standard]
MAAGISLRVTPKSKADDFVTHYEALRDHILFACLDDAGREQGLAIGIVKKKFKEDMDGAFIQVHYVQCSDPYYRHWVEESKGNDLYHHLCRQALSSCKRKVGRDSVVHVQRWTGITENEAVDVLREWKLKPLPPPSQGPRGKPLEEIPLTTSSKSKARKKDRRDDGLDTTDFDSSDELVPSVEERDEKAGVKKVLSGRTETGGGGHQREHRRRKGEESKKRKKEKTPPRKKARTPALDAVLEDPSVDDYEKDASYNEKRLAVLRSRLGEVKKSTEGRKGASAVLAARIRDEQEEGAKEKRKKKDAEKVITALQSLAKGKKRSSSDDSSGDDEDDLGGRGDRGSDMASKQRKLRKLSQNNPGCLLLRGYSLMHETLGTLYGSGSSSSKDAEQIPQPAATRYLLTCALPQIDVRQLGEEKLRELRTLSTALDCLVSGHPSNAGDVLMQRLKSILMGIRDNTNAASRYLEIIPSELFPTGATEAETEFARKAAYSAAKGEALLYKEWRGCVRVLALLVGFDCLLRPGEIYDLKVGDITWASKRATLTLRSTKTGIRKGAEEMVFCESRLATKWLKKACAGKSPHQLIVGCSRKHFRSLSFNLLQHFAITGNFSLYSLRRGGATWHFLGERSMEATLLRGRWQSTSTARIYLADAAATLVHLQLSSGQVNDLTTCAKFL